MTDQTQTEVQKEFDPSEGNPFVSDAGARARDKMIEPQRAPAPTQEQDVDSKPSMGNRIAAGAAGVAVLAAYGGVGAAAADHVLPQETIAVATSDPIPQGGDITGAVDNAIEKIETQGVDPADTTERNDVISQAVNIHSVDGVVQPNTQVEVTATESPIFHDVTYTATDPSVKNK